jgi:type 1 glutamine amidotransferase/nicotinamidase-related amidase
MPRSKRTLSAGDRFVSIVAASLALTSWLSSDDFSAAQQPAAVKRPHQLTVQRRGDDGNLIREQLALEPSNTAIVVVDMWDKHPCHTYTLRVGNLVPRMNKTLEAARKLGIQIVFAPSDTLKFYVNCLQRNAMLAIPQHPVPNRVAFDPPGNPQPIDGCECGPEQPCRSRWNRCWTRQHPDLEITEQDLIGDCNNGRELLNLCAQRGIDTLIYMGVASNMCVQYRSMGIRNMKSYGLKAIVCADLVQAISANGLGPDKKTPDRNFTPAEGTAQTQRHIERYVAPTFESRQLIAAAGLDPHADDPRPHIVFVVAEHEYDTAATLPEFAKKYLEQDYRCTFCFAKGAVGADRNDVPGLEALYDADLLVISMRRRALPVVQMDHLERYIRAGKPLVAIRVSVVPFQVQGEIPPGHVVWDRFDKEVLGCNYHGYDGRSRELGCDLWIRPEVADHPILSEISVTKWHSRCWIYKQRPLAETATPLVEGRWSQDGDVEPVAWANIYRGARVFYTTLGHEADFKMDPFRQLLLAGIRWTMEQ